jgi:hypothetical protein
LLVCCGVAVLLFRFRLAPPPRMDVGRIASTKKRMDVGRTMDMVGPHLTRLMGFTGLASAAPIQKMSKLNITSEQSLKLILNLSDLASF